MQTTIALPRMPRPMKCGTKILGDLFQPVVTGNQVVFPGEFPLQLLLLLLVQFGGFQQGFHVVVQVLVGELQFGDAVFVVEGHRGPVLNGLLEVVDADVIAEDLPRLLPRRPSAACR